ncbi:MAG: ABC transporter substrate-binding protein [Alphaproteobacteria bacterium]|nr:ABC transporter substrate-binding protein [Alphaproteobacteria bacterium]
MPRILRLGMVLEPPHLDPTIGVAGAVDEIVHANIFEGLTRLNPAGEVRASLARSWYISDDGLEYVFSLRRGVRFHDGSIFDAHDVKFSLDRARAGSSVNGQKDLFSDILSVDVIDALTVRVRLIRANADFLYNMAWGNAVIVNPKTASQNAFHPVGTGPFAFSRWVRGDHVTLVKSPSYQGPSIRLDRVDFRFIPDPAAAFSAMMAGDLDAFPRFPAPELLPRFTSDPRFSVIVGTTEGEVILSINNGRSPFRDIRVRRAIAHAIDRRAVIKGAVFGYGVPIGTHFAPHHPAYVDLTSLSSYDPVRSGFLLSKAGFSDGFETTLILPPPIYARRAGEVIAAQLRAVGIRARIINMEWAQWLERVFERKDFDLTVIAHTEAMDIGIYARPDYYFQYKNSEFQKLMKSLKEMTDPSRRRFILQQAQKKIAVDYVNAYLFQVSKIGVSNVKLRGLWRDSPLQLNDLTSVYWGD